MQSKKLQTRHEIRQQIRQQRQKLCHQQQRKYSTQLVEQAHQHPRLKEAKNVALYLAHDGELCTQALVQWCWDNNIKTFMPVLDPDNPGHLIFLHYHEASKMVANKFGIAEPCPKTNKRVLAHELDIIFTPLVAFDKQGNRLGMGGGFYDRTLSPWFSSQQGPYPIGIAHNLQQVEQLPTESWDVPLPEVITPEKIWRWR